MAMDHICGYGGALLLRGDCTIAHMCKYRVNAEVTVYPEGWGGSARTIRTVCASQFIGQPPVENAADLQPAV